MRACGLLFLLALAACNSEPSFDERYETAEKEIRQKAAELNQDISEAQAGAAPSESATEADPATN